MDERRLELVRRLYESRMRADFMFTQKRLPNLDGIEFGVPQLSILLSLNYAKDQQATIKELTEFTHKTSSAITQLVEKLENGGYVTRTHSLEDRRLVFVRLTETGEEKFADFYSHLIESLATITSPLTEEELTEYTRLNEVIADRI